MLYILALAAVVLKSCKILVWRFAMKDGWDEWTALLAHNVLGTALVVSALGLPTLSTLSISGFSLLLMMGLSWVSGGLCVMRAAKDLDAASGELYGAVSFISVTAFGILFFGESLSWWGTLGITLMIVAAIFQSGRPGSQTLEAAFFRICGAFFIALGVISTKVLTEFLPMETIVVSGYLIPTAVLCLIRPGKLKGISRSLKSSRGLFILAPVASVVSYYCYTAALSEGGIIITNAIHNCHLAIVFVLGIVLLRERECVMRRSASCLASMLGAIVVCVF